MTSRAYRIQRVLLWVTLVMLTVALLAWPISLWRGAVLTYGTDCQRTVRTEDGSADEWEHTISNFGLDSRDGTIEFGGEVSKRTTAVGQMPSRPGVPQGWLFYGYWYDPGSTFSDRLCESLKPRLELGSLYDWSIPGVGVRVEKGPVVFGASMSLHHLLLAGVLGGLAFRLWYPIRRSAMRRTNRQCVRCGYDRRGLAADAACPECGRQTGQKE